ncbi:CHY zinc finger protein [Halobacillus sp. A5]|uniref:CHY zinc finger protein n=1 Tax=Halobacillus sp. A5 TaxID=2880263 RepID=UPI0020A66BF9|nr:CHY zinc finger protein [Halobacillus sp. A5]MCP3027318.1 hypothetical protein [Halobacillus sp. A5]
MNHPKVKGLDVDSNTRCRHYHSEVDIIAIKFNCCHEYYACYYCHKELAGHKESTWPKNKRDEYAIMCGKCKKELTIHQYMNTTNCPHCQHTFNERCRNHYPLYFEM